MVRAETPDIVVFILWGYNILRILLDTQFSSRVQETNREGAGRCRVGGQETWPGQKNLIRSNSIIPGEVDRSSAVRVRARESGVGYGKRWHPGLAFSLGIEGGAE